MKTSLCLIASVLLLTPQTHAKEEANKDEVALTREAKASIELAQQWLAGQQKADGSFYLEVGRSTGIVGAAVMAWMVNGNQPGEGRYGKNVAKGVDYILSCAQPSGLLFKGKSSHVMYEHGLATICIAEAWGQTQDKRIYDKLKKAIDLIVRCQNEKGGWRYQPKIKDDDLSATVMQLLALRAAKDAGITVPKDVIDLAIKYVESCRTKKSGGFSGFSYVPGHNKTWSTTAAGVMSLLLCGEYKASRVKDGLNYLMDVRKKKKDKKKWFIYAHYYAAMAMYKAGSQGKKYEKYWNYWYPNISKELISNQEKKGRNKGRFKKDKKFGVWSTAMCVLILGVPYRYLPIYQR